MQIKTTLTKTVNFIAVVLSTLVSLACIFHFQFSLLTGPFIDVLLFIGLLLIALIYSLALFPLNGFGKLISYIPITILLVSFSLTFLISNINAGNELHYLMHKRNLETIDDLSMKAGIYEMTDMLRFHKRLNKKEISNGSNYTSKIELQESFGKYITDQNLNIEQVFELRNRLEESNIISLLRSGEYLILTVDGWVDSEYGYVKSKKRELKEGEIMPPFGFRITRLIKFENGWYFIYTT